MNKPVLLDLYCCAGGAAEGYVRAGFEVVGVDVKPQPHYPFPFLQMDALEAIDLLLKRNELFFSNGKGLVISEISAFHASPPCQKYSVMTNGRWQDRLANHPDLIAPTRELLLQTGKPFIIENVPGAKEELISPIMLCGTMFQLQTKSGSQLRRHRYFELHGFDILFTPFCQHNNGSVIGVYGGGQHPDRRVPATIGVYGHAGGTSKRDGPSFGTQDRKDAMGIQWMSGNELSEAIPPAYTEFIGNHLIKAL